jgi:hypothetical protein
MMEWCRGRRRRWRGIEEEVGVGDGGIEGGDGGAEGDGGVEGQEKLGSLTARN